MSYSSVKGLLFLREFILTVLIILVAVNASAAFKYTAVGMDAHEFSGEDIVTGDQISIKDLYKDNLTIVVFWATWSPRSIEQLQDMNRLKSEYPGKAIEVVAVNVDAPQISAAVRTQITQTVTSLDLKFPVIIDKDLKIFYTYGVIAVPSTAIIDTAGTVRYDPGGYGMFIRDIIVDSVKAFLGLVEATLKDTLPPGYQPQKKSARYYNLALNLKQTGMFDRALENLELSRQADSLFAGPLALMGEILFHQGKLEEAQAAYSRGAALDNTGVAIWAGWGRALLLSGDTMAARQKLEQALTLDNNYTPALIDLGLCLAYQDSVDKALESLIHAQGLNRGDPMTHYYLGMVYRKAGNDGEAVRAYMEALSILFPGE